MADDGIDNLHAHLVGKLNRVGVNLAVLDRLLALGLAVESDDQHLRPAGFFERSPGPECCGIVDGEDAAQIRVRLQRILGGLVAHVLRAAALQLCDDGDLRLAARVVRVDDFGEALHAKLARLGLLEVEHGNLAARLTERLDHRAPRFLAAAKIVGGNLGHDLHPGFVTRNVHGEDGDAGCVRLLNHRDD